MTVAEPDKVVGVPNHSSVDPEPALLPLRLRSVDKSFGTHHVLDGVSLDVEAGEVLAVVGPSGSGKTTLARIVAGFERPDGGSVEVAGRLVADSSHWVPPERRRVGIVPQDGALFPHFDVAGNVGAGLPHSPDRQRRIDECLELVGLSEFRAARPDELSGGQQQRVALARALAPSPSLILLDEPFSALDAGLRSQLRTDVAAALSATSSTALLITHDQDEALSVADRVAVLLRGRVVQLASPAEAYGRPATLEVARFLGRLVELPATRTDQGLLTALGCLPDASPSGDATSTRVIAAVRPEQVHFRDGATPATVDVVHYLGHDAIVELHLDDGTPLAARWGASSGPDGSRGPLPVVGSRVGVEVIGSALAFPVGTPPPPV